MAIDFYGARAYVLLRLKQELPATLFYHSLQHTRDDVAPAALHIARRMDVNGDDLLLVRTAALFHDIGYLVQREQHEAIGVDMCQRVLPGFGYSSGQIGKIAGMIMATRLPQSPRDTLEAIVADADLDSLGRTDFLRTSLNLRRELAEQGIVRTDEEWFAGQREFLRGHTYFTRAARVLRDDGKQRNIALLDMLLAELRTSLTPPR
jgi:uncharacterized protein